MNGGGTAVSCTITVVNYVTIGGTLSATPPSTLVATRCVGASGLLSALTCTTATTTSLQPIVTVQQCNGSGNGGGGRVNCIVTITNHFTGDQDAITATAAFATVYQCVGSVITGPGAPGTCTPVNTPGITSVTAATVGQCNGSGNGGTSVGFVCTVTGGSTMTSLLPAHVDQCNHSGNGGGALVTCQTTVVNDVIAVEATATPTAAPTAAPTAVPTVAPTAVPTVAPPAPTAVAGAIPSTPPAAVPVVPAVAVPIPAATGNAGLTGGRNASLPLWALGLLGIGLAGLGLATRRVIRARAGR